MSLAEMGGHSLITPVPAWYGSLDEAASFEEAGDGIVHPFTAFAVSQWKAGAATTPLVK
jgi:hypothetical protein